jgi:LmbE family N-acetylglucosaminyl deacetylase
VMHPGSAVPIEKLPWRRRRWLILAPHPDDETLGAGALIAQVAAEGCFAGLIYLTDGSGSHGADEVDPARLIATRKREARRALQRLSSKMSPAPMFLGWNDASPEIAGGAAFERSCRRLVALCARLRVDVLATTTSNEPHCDHAAATELANAVQTISKRPLAIAEYIVWGSAPSSRTHLSLITAQMLPGRRRHALAAHRSQLTASLGAGFRLPKDKRSMADRDLLYVRRR